MKSVLSSRASDDDGALESQDDDISEFSADDDDDDDYSSYEDNDSSYADDDNVGDGYVRPKGRKRKTSPVGEGRQGSTRVRPPPVCEGRQGSTRVRRVTPSPESDSESSEEDMQDSEGSSGGDSPVLSTTSPPPAAVVETNVFVRCKPFYDYIASLGKKLVDYLMEQYYIFNPKSVYLQDFTKLWEDNPVATPVIYAKYRVDADDGKYYLYKIGITRNFQTRKAYYQQQEEQDPIMLPILNLDMIAPEHDAHMVEALEAMTTKVLKDDDIPESIKIVMDMIVHRGGENQTPNRKSIHTGQPIRRPPPRGQ